MVKKKPNRERLYIETYDFQHSIEKDVVFLTLFIVFLKKHFFYTKIAKYWKMGIRCSFEWRKFPLSSLFISRSPLGQQWLLLLALPLLKKQKTLWPLRPVQGGVGSNPTTATTRWIIEFFFQKSKKTSSSFPYLFQTEISQRNYLGSNNIHKNRIPTGQWMHKGIYGKKYSLFTIGACSLW